MSSLLPTKSECRRCVCTRKYVDSTTTRATSRSRKSKKKRVKFPLPLQLTSTEKAKKRAEEKAAVIKAKLDVIRPKGKLGFPEGKPQQPKLSSFVALQAKADREAKKRAVKEAKLRAQKNKDKFKVVYGADGKPDKDGKPIKGSGKGGKGGGRRGKGKRRRKGKGKGKGKGERIPRPPGWVEPPKKRAIKISYPSQLRLKTWIPPYLLPWPPKPRVNVNVPPFGTRKWVPPYLRRKKPRDRIKVDYPALTLRRWIPPYLRKRLPRAKLASLHGKSFRIDPSSLAKYWHRFKFVDDWYSIITGDYSQTYPKYGFKTNGFQAPCNCMVAMTISKLFRMKYWHKKFLNGVLDMGNGLYLESLRHLPSDVNPNIKVEQVYKSFYFGHTKITMTLSDTSYVGKVFKDYESELYLRNVLKTFFKNHYSGILIIKKQYRAVWKQAGKYFLFDPTDHDEFGRKWDGQPGYGYCYVVMFLTRDKLVDFIHESVQDTTVNYKFTLIPCDILRTIEVVTDYPDCLLEFEEPPKITIAKKDLDRLLPPPPESKVEEPVEEDPQWLELDEVAPEALPPDVPERKREIKKPFEKPKADSITYFSELVPGRQGILRANTYQTDPKFSKYKGQQSLANAVAAIAMLRVNKSKKWTSTILDDVLKTGEVIYHESKKKKYKQDDLKFEHIVEKITIGDKVLTPVFEELTVMGKLQSNTDNLLDLLPALREYFTDNSAGILCGPLPLAIWYEDGLFYMFDPDERDSNGNIIIRSYEIGSEIIFKDIPSGRACLTWYYVLDDLVEMYMKNVDKSRRRDYYSICKVEIKDYVPGFNNWNNFKGVKMNKWILRGSFSQSSKRFDKETRNTQCTAMAALALAYTKIVPIHEWTTETIDEIITEGDLYYLNCVKNLKDTKRFLSTKLLVEELLRRTMIGDKDILFEIDDCVVNGIVSLKDEPISMNLLQGLIEFFENNDNGILTAKSLSIAVWKFKDLYYLFDSHSRDENGFVSNFGNACVLRFVNVAEMADCIEANFGVEENCFYNISRVEPTIMIVIGDGTILPPIKNYMQIDDLMAILRGNISDVSDEFGFNRGKQVIANCVVAAGMATLYPPLEWTSHIIDTILRHGDKLYQESKEFIYKDMIEFAKVAQTKTVKPQEKGDALKKGRRGGGFPLIDVLLDDHRTMSRKSRLTENLSSFSRQFFERRGGGFPVSMDVDPLAVDPIEDMNSDRILKQFKIGVNKIEVDFELINQSVIRNDLEQKVTKYLQDPPLDDKDKRELLLETDHVTYYIFKDNNVYYLFTSQPCDHEGCFFGREEWKIPTKEEIEEEDVLDEELFETEMTEVEPEDEEQILLNENYDLYYNFPFESVEEEMSDIFKHSSHFWRSMAEKDGRAFIAWFTRPEYLVKHVLLNFPDEMKDEKYSLKRILVKNVVQVKEYFNPKETERVDPYDGDYYEFKEIERCRWILRGSFDQYYEMFPEKNRGLQTIANCFTTVGFFHLYNVMTFKPMTIDTILKYGDRLLTFTKNLRRKSLRENKEIKLTEPQIDEILGHETFGINDIFRVYSIDEEQVTIEVEEYKTVGEINASENDVILSLPKGLREFFDGNKYGILCSKGVCVAIVKGSSRMYYMFDPMSRGPSGINCTNGVACITRFCEIDSLANIFLSNLPKEGKNAYVIHSISVSSKPVLPPPLPPIAEQHPDPSLVGYAIVVPGKRIIRGTLSQEDALFGRGENVQSACVALVALAMSLIHRCCNWSRPIIDEIVCIGDEVYANALDKLGFSFNPWEQKMTLEYVPPDFIVGELKANCELRDTTQNGIFNIKDAKIQNLRQGIERFFEENTHGVIESESLTVAIWEDEYEQLIYIFDPNPRGPTGMPLAVNGTACAIGCKDAKMAADHIISLLGDQAQLPYVIIPIEIVIGKNKKKCKRFLRTLRKTESTLERRRKEVEAKKRKEQMRLEQLGRCQFYNIPGSDISTLRGTRSQNSKTYNATSRNNQDIPMCLTAFVMERLLPLNKWTSKTIDQVLDIGDQLYKDSFVVNAPTDQKIGLDYIIRQVIIKDVKVHVAISKPVIINKFTRDNLLKGLTIYFMQRQFGMVSIDNEWISIYYRDDHYYLFDPHDRNILGEVDIPGAAVLIKYPDLDQLSKRLCDNYCDGETFQIVILGIKAIEKYEQTDCRCGVNIHHFSYNVT